MKNLPLFSFLRSFFIKEPVVEIKEPVVELPMNVVQHRRQPIHKRKEYRCLVCLFNWPGINVFTERIDNHPRLTRTHGLLCMDHLEFTKAVIDDFDIILIAGSDGDLETEALLDLPEMATKMVVMISDDSKSQERMKNRVDYWMPEEFIETDAGFQSFIAPVIDELDNDYPPRQPTPMKPVYNCFIWQIGLSEQMMRCIEESERLHATHVCSRLTYSDEESAAVQKADILILSSGGDSPYSLIYFLDHYDIRSKVVVVSTVFSAERVLNRTPRRIDYILEKFQIAKSEDLDRFFAAIINDLDGDAD